MGELTVFFLSFSSLPVVCVCAAVVGVEEDAIGGLRKGGHMSET